MINEEVSSKAINLEVRLAKATAKELFKILKKLLKQAEKLGGFDKLIKAEGSQVKLKDMVKKKCFAKKSTISSIQRITCCVSAK